MASCANNIYLHQAFPSAVCGTGKRGDFSLSGAILSLRKNHLSKKYCLYSLFRAGKTQKGLPALFLCEQQEFLCKNF